MKDERLLELAISGLEAQRDRIEDELNQLRSRVPAGSKSAAQKSEPTKPRKGRRKMTAAQKKAHSERMKKIWAEKRKAKK